MIALSTSLASSAKNYLFARSGIVRNAPGPGQVDSFLADLLMSLVMGAFCGLILGVILFNVFRYVSLVRGRTVGGYGWTIGSVIAGALGFALFTVTRDD